MGDEDCIMVGGRTKKYRADEMHDKGVLACSGSPNIDHCLVVAVKEELLSRPLLSLE